MRVYMFVCKFLKDQSPAHPGLASTQVLYVPRCLHWAAVSLEQYSPPRPQPCVWLGEEGLGVEGALKTKPFARRPCTEGKARPACVDAEWHLALDPSLAAEPKPQGRPALKPALGESAAPSCLFRKLHMCPSPLSMEEDETEPHLWKILGKS